MKTICISGITGQLGAYLVDHIINLEEEVKIVGMVRRSATPNLKNIEEYLDLKLKNGRSVVKLEYGDVTDSGSINRIVDQYQPHEFYNLAAQSHVRISYDIPEYSMQSVAIGAINCLEALRKYVCRCKYYNAGSSEQFGDCIDSDGFQRETTPFRPNSPYAVAKLASFHLTRLYREAYGMFACSSINFNFESKKRGENFVTRKITKYVAGLYSNKVFNRGAFPLLSLGNLEAYRDWSYAGDVAIGIYNLMQQDQPDDYVFASGETHSIKELLEVAFGYIDTDWHDYVTLDPSLLRPKELSVLRGDSSKARQAKIWKPQVTFKELIEMMVQEDIKAIRD